MKHFGGYILFICLFTIVSCEVLLRLMHIGDTWPERTGQKYSSGFNQTHAGWLYTWPANTEFDLDQQEFKIHYKVNALGLREKDTVYTDTTALRILCLGDSYTEGFGAPYDSSYPRALERALNKQGCHCQIYNAGKAGSDPFYNYMLLKQQLLRLKPQVVITTFNSSDIGDYVFRGGMERFKADSTTQYKKGPWYEPLYARSYLARFIIDKATKNVSSNMFLSQYEHRQVYCPATVRETARLFDSLNVLGADDGFKLIVVEHPIVSELLLDGEYRQFMQQLFVSMQDSLNHQRVSVINMWNSLDATINKQNGAYYAYPKDCHFTPAGYQLFTDNLLQAINEKYPDFCKSPN